MTGEEEYQSLGDRLKRNLLPGTSKKTSRFDDINPVDTDEKKREHEKYLEKKLEAAFPPMYPDELSQLLKTQSSAKKGSRFGAGFVFYIVVFEALRDFNFRVLTGWFPFPAYVDRYFVRFWIDSIFLARFWRCFFRPRI